MKVMGFFLFFILWSQLAFAAQIFRYANGSEPKDLDPQIVTGDPENGIMQNIFEGLVGKDLNTMAIVPGVAEKWEQSKDLKHFTFHLRKNAKWTNGDPVTAKDFVYGFQRALDPANGSMVAYQLYYLKNGKAINEKKKPVSELGAKAKGDFTLEIELEESTPFFLRLCAYSAYYPAHRPTIEKHKQRWTRAENIVSNGPYKMVSWEMNQMVKAVKNPLYWDKDHVKLDEIHFVAIESNDTEEKMFRGNQIDMTSIVPLEKIDFWKKHPSKVYYDSPQLAVYYYAFNTKRKPLDNPKVRKALSYAFDRERIVKYVVKGGQAPATGIVPPNCGGYPQQPFLPTDLSRLAEAKKLLAEAGYPGGKGFPVLEILYNTMESHKKIAEAIQEMWKNNLGIQIKLTNQEWKVYLDTMDKGQFDITRMTWNADYNDPNSFLDMWMTGNFNNRAQWSNAAYDALLHKSLSEGNHAKRLEMFRQAEGILMDEMPIAPFYYFVEHRLIKPWVKGFRPNLEHVMVFKDVTIEPH